MTRAAYTKVELAKRLCCAPARVFRVADQRGIPYDLDYGVNAAGETITKRKYDKAATEEYLLERARLAARKQAS